jgi:hypothetical protein
MGVAGVVVTGGTGLTTGLSNATAGTGAAGEAAEAGRRAAAAALITGELWLAAVADGGVAGGVTR